MLQIGIFIQKAPRKHILIDFKKLCKNLKLLSFKVVILFSDNCRQRNLLSDAEIYVYETKLEHRFRRLHGNEGQNVLNDIKTNQGVAKFAMINPYLFLIRLKRPASSISYINVEGMFYHRSKTAKDFNKFDLLILEFCTLMKKNSCVILS